MIKICVAQGVHGGGGPGKFRSKKAALLRVDGELEFYDEH